MEGGKGGMGSTEPLIGHCSSPENVSRWVLYAACQFDNTAHDCAYSHTHNNIVE